MKDSTVIRMFCFSPIGIRGWSSAGRFKVGKTNKFLALLLDTFLIILAKSSWKAASIARMDLNISDSLSFDSILMRTTISLTPNLKDYNFIKKNILQLLSLWFIIGIIGINFDAKKSPTQWRFCIKIFSITTYLLLGCMFKFSSKKKIFS